jgi:hypothetical protein
MLKGMREWRKLVLVAVCIIAMIIFGGDYAFAEETPSVAEKPSIETVEKPKISDSEQLQTTPCLPGKPCVETRHFNLLLCVPGRPCPQRPPIPPKHSSNPPAMQEPDHSNELAIQ